MMMSDFLQTTGINRKVMSEMRSCLVVTYKNINLSDDLIRCGVESIVRRALGESILFRYVSRDNPFSYFGKRMFDILNSIKLVRRVGNIRAFHKLLKIGSPFRKVDFIIIAGTPWFYSDAAGRYSIGQQKSAQILIREYLNYAKRGGIPVICIGLGNSFSLGESASVLFRDEQSVELLHKFLSGTSLVIVRDELAEYCVQQLGFECRRLICPSVFAKLSVDCHVNQGRQQKIVIVLSAYILHLHGASEVESFHKKLADCVLQNISKNQIVLLAHNEDDKKLCQRVFPGWEVVSVATVDEYLQILRNGCKAVVTTRVHASMVAHSLGKPVMLYKIDERAIIAENAGINTRVYSDINVFELNRFISGSLENTIPDYSDDMEQYCQMIRTSLQCEI